MFDAFTSANDAEITSATVNVAAQLEQLNCDFLQLLILEWREGAEPGGAVRLASLSIQSISTLAAASAQLRQLAALGFSLFSLRFDNPELWRRIPRMNDAADQRYVPAGSGSESTERRCKARRSGFIECALFYAWHLAHRDRGAARLHLGLPDELIGILLNLELWRIRSIALSYPELLAPRWPENACFWPDLLRYLHSGDRQHLEYARLLGSQLLAQELEPSVIERLTNRRSRLFNPPKKRR